MSNSDNSCTFHEVKNDIVDIITEEFSDEENNDIENNIELAEICPYDEKDIKYAKDLGMSVEDMFKMFQEIN